MVELIEGNSIINIKTEEVLRNILAKTDLSKKLELMIYGHGTSSLTVLTREDGAFLMYLREEGDTGFSSRSKKSNSDTLKDFNLNNGQIDKYPESHLRDHKDAIDAIIEYFLTGGMFEKIRWNKD